MKALYYACYYAVAALLLKYDIQTQTHNGVKTMPGLHFVSLCGDKSTFIAYP